MILKKGLQWAILGAFLLAKYTLSGRYASALCRYGGRRRSHLSLGDPAGAQAPLGSASGRAGYAG